MNEMNELRAPSWCLHPDDVSCAHTRELLLGVEQFLHSPLYQVSLGVRRL